MALTTLGKCSRCGRDQVLLLGEGSSGRCRWCLYETVISPAQYLAAQGEEMMVHGAIIDFVGNEDELYGSANKSLEVAISIVRNWLMLYLMKTYPGKDSWMEVENYLPQVLPSKPDSRETKQSKQFRNEFLTFMKNQLSGEPE